MSNQLGKDLLERARVVPAPGNDLIGADEHGIGAVEVPGLFAFQIDNVEVDAFQLFELLAMRCETQQRPVETKAIVKRSPLGKPEVRRAAPPPRAPPGPGPGFLVRGRARPRPWPRAAPTAAHRGGPRRGGRPAPRR